MRLACCASSPDVDLGDVSEGATVFVEAFLVESSCAGVAPVPRAGSCDGECSVVPPSARSPRGT